MAFGISKPKCCWLHMVIESEPASAGNLTLLVVSPICLTLNALVSVGGSRKETIQCEGITLASKRRNH